MYEDCVPELLILKLFVNPLPVNVVLCWGNCVPPNIPVAKTATPNCETDDNAPILISEGCGTFGLSKSYRGSIVKLLLLPSDLYLF